MHITPQELLQLDAGKEISILWPADECREGTNLEWICPEAQRDGAVQVVSVDPAESGMVCATCKKVMG